MPTRAADGCQQTKINVHLMTHSVVLTYCPVFPASGGFPSLHFKPSFRFEICDCVEIEITDLGHPENKLDKEIVRIKDLTLTTSEE